MDETRVDDGNPAAPGSRQAPSAAARRESNPRDHLLKLMFFQASRAAGEVPDEPRPSHSTGTYVPLRHSRASAADRLELAQAGAAAPVRLDSPATDVMTDLRRVSAVTIDRDASIVDANHLMIARSVRALFVVDDRRQTFGIVTSTDILGERPIQFAQARGIRYDEVVVRDIMTRADRLEVLDLRDVLRARVGDVIATLRLAGRQHALAVEANGAQQTICGIFSLTQIGRRLGIPPQQVHDIARTFAEIEALIAS